MASPATPPPGPRRRAHHLRDESPSRESTQSAGEPSKNDDEIDWHLWESPRSAPPGGGKSKGRRWKARGSLGDDPVREEKEAEAAASGISDARSFTSDSIVTLATPFSSAAGLALSFATSASVPAAAPPPFDSSHFSPYALAENEYSVPYFYPPFPSGGPMFPVPWGPQEGYAFPAPSLEYDVLPPPSASYPLLPPLFIPAASESVDQDLRPMTPPSAPPHTANAFNYTPPNFAPPGPGVLYHSQSFPNLPLVHHHRPLFPLPSAFDHSDRATGATCPANDNLSGGASDDAAGTCGRELFCTFYPCGCSTCRDHYNVVVTHGRDVPADEDAPHKRIFTCAVCGKRSEKICPLSTRGHFEHHAGPSVQQTSSSPIRLRERPSMDRIQEDAPADEDDEIIGMFGVKFHRVPGRDLSYFGDDVYPPFAPELTPMLPYAFPGPSTSPLTPMSLLPALAPPFYPLPLSFTPQSPPSPPTTRPRPLANSPSQPLKHPLPSPPTQRAQPLPSQTSSFLASGHAPTHYRPRAASSPGTRTSFPSMSTNPKRSPIQARFPPRSTPTTPASMRSLSLSPEIGTQRWNDPRGPKTEPSEPYQLQPNVWPIIKIPFGTTVPDLEKWLPPFCLPSKQNVVSAIHIILHRATGRTLPHCYLETHSAEMALLIINQMDRQQLGDRTVRIKWERRGELMRDLFDQSEYFLIPARTLAAAPIPPAPICFQLPPTILDSEDFAYLLKYCENLAPWRERPFERPFLNVVSLIAKFPWYKPELWNDGQRDEFFDCAYVATRIAIHNSKRERLFNPIVEKLLGTIENCIGFTPRQKWIVRELLAFAKPHLTMEMNLSPQTLIAHFPYLPRLPPSPPLARDRQKLRGTPPTSRPSAADISVVNRLRFKPSQLDLSAATPAAQASFAAGTTSTPLETPPVTPPPTMTGYAVLSLTLPSSSQPDGDHGKSTTCTTPTQTEPIV